MNLLLGRCRASIFVMALGVTTGACTFISKDGPEGPDISSGAAISVPQTSPKLDYVLVDLSPEAVYAAKRYSAAFVHRFTSFQRGGATGDVSIGIGDIVSVSVFEAESGGLFIPKDASARPGNFVQIPNEQVDAAGNISIPYIEGPVHVSGRTPRDVSREITAKLKVRAIEPQAVLTVLEHRGNDVSVLGDVTTAQRFSLDPGGIQLTGAIARAGGPKNPDYETLVSVKRHNLVQTAELTAIVHEPSQDIHLQPGDVVYVAHEPRVFMILGATVSPGSVGGTNNRRFAFENENMTLTEGLSKAGGLDTTRSSPDEFYLFRYESPALLKSLGIDVDRYDKRLVPTVYKVNFGSPDGFFLASQFNLRDKDVVFVAESASADINKVLTIASGAAITAADASQIK